MDNKTTAIDGKQFFAISFIFLMCNDLARGITRNELKQDIWIANIIGLIGALILFLLFYLIYKNSGCSSFTEAIEHILGKYLAKAIFIIYPLYYLMQITFIIANMISKIDLFLLEGAPFYIIGAIIIFTSIYIAIKGVEPLARSAFLHCLATIFTISIFIVILLLVSKQDFTNIKPILEIGLEKVVIEGVKMSCSAPFGETFALIILFGYVNNKAKNFKFGLYGILLAGFVMSLTTVLCLAIIGPFLINTGKNPSLQLISLIEYQNYIQRLDLIVICIMLMFVVYRFAILLIGCLSMMKRIVNFPASKNFIPLLVIGIFITIIPEILMKNYNELIFFKLSVIYPFILPTFEIAIPMLIIVISFFRKKKQPKKQLQVPIPEIIG